MAQRDLIIGAFTNYNYNQLKPWVESIDECGFTGDKVMVVGNVDSKETINELTKRKFIVVFIPAALNNLPIHVSRFLIIYDYLKNHWEDYRFVIATDVKDVYFQQDPSIFLDNFLYEGGTRKILIGSESLKYKNESWGDENLLQTFGPYIYNEFKDETIYNVGVIGGRAEYVKDLVLGIFLSAINRPIPIVDQAVFNVLIHTQPWKDIVFKANQADGWVCHAGTTVDPSKIDRFRPYLLEAEPTFVDGVVLTSLGKPFCMVHQYDRIPEWKKFIQKKYKKNNPDEFFTYRT